MKAALMAALAAHDSRTSDDAPDSRRGMCGADCGGSPCARDKDHPPPCSPDGEPCRKGHYGCNVRAHYMIDLRATVRAALAAPGAPTQAALARAAGIEAPNLNAWLAGRRTIPQEKIEAVLTYLGASIVFPRASTTQSADHAAR